MASNILHRSASTIQLHSCTNSYDLHNRYPNQSLRFISRRFDGSVAPIRTVTCSSSSRNKLHFLRTYPASFSRAITPFAKNSSTEAALVLLRHGESMWNLKNLFTGCVDVALTEKGVEEAIEAGRRISHIPVDMIYTSSLIRARMTAMLAMTQHRCEKVPVILHNESEQAKAWSQISSKETMNKSIPVITAWQLNERMYGSLQGLNKQDTAERYGAEKVLGWRRSYDIPPPNGESLETCAKRAVAYFREQIEPQLQMGKHLMVVSHKNTLRSIIMYLECLTLQQVMSLEVSTGVPLLYVYKKGNFLKRGSPVGPTEASVYAYTKSLAHYRHNLDEWSC